MLHVILDEMLGKRFLRLYTTLLLNINKPTFTTYQDWYLQILFAIVD